MIKPMRKFIDDEDGAILVFFAMLLVVFLGIIALSYDFGRQAATQSELQSYADNVALAAAGELDGAPDALTRAQRAAAGLITDSQTFGAGDRILSGARGVTLTFYARRTDALQRINPETRPQRARFVRATLDPREVRGTFSRAVARMTGTGEGPDRFGAQAVAGYGLYGCNTTPLTFCARTAGVEANLSAGATLNLSVKANTAALAPGALSLVQSALPLVDTDGVCSTLQRAGDVLGVDLCQLGARGAKSSCLATDDLDLAGNDRLTSISAGLNMRLGLFEGPAAGLGTDSLYKVVPNLLDTAGVTVCPAGFPSFPPDDCQATNSCTAANVGVWTNGRRQFVETYYNNTDPFPQAKTRLQFYDAMIQAQASGSAGGLVGGLLGGVTGTVGGLLGSTPKLCAPLLDADPNRRIVVAAAVDCTGLSAGADLSDVPVLNFVELFLNAPATTAGVSVEVVNVVAPNGPAPRTKDVVIRDIVQLYQ